MEIIQSPSDMTSWSNRMIVDGGKIALVPTMGYFHDGHLALMKRAREECDLLVVSLFVNPIQFGPNEDLDKYPRDFEGDAAKVEQVGSDVLFAPDASAMYRSPLTRVVVSGLTETLCGSDRPRHFEGVTTVVAKLFHIVKPHVAVFGEKDFQQLAVIRRMVGDLNWDISIVGHPIVREHDGLAMSSRNMYLSSEERKKALSLSSALAFARGRVQAGCLDAEELIAEISTRFFSEIDEVQVDYISIINSEDLSPQQKISENSQLAIAAKVGKTRLIDNCRLFEE